MFGGKILSDLIGPVPATKRIYQPGLESLGATTELFRMDMIWVYLAYIRIAIPACSRMVLFGCWHWRFMGFNTVLPERKYDDLTLNDIMQGVIQAFQKNHMMTGHFVHQPALKHL